VTQIDRPTLVGAAVGASIAFVWAWLGFGAIVLIAVLASLGALIGHLLVTEGDASRRTRGRPR